MRHPRSTWAVVLASPFGRHLLVVGVFFWLFLHAVAAGIAGVNGSSPHSWGTTVWVMGGTTVWVMAMTLGLLAVEVRRKRLTDFFAALGLSGMPVWGAALIALGILEIFFWVVMAIAEVP